MSDNIQAKTKFGGMMTRFPETKNYPEMAWLAYNCKITGNSIQPIKGFTLLGQTSSVVGERIRDGCTFIKVDGTRVKMRVRDNATNNVLEWYDTTNKKWYILLNMTSGCTTMFADYNGTNVSAMAISNGTDNYSKWSGAITRLTSAVAAGAISIPVADTTDFPATGTIIYNGTEIAYTSKTAISFVVASAHASAGADDGVAQAVDDSTYSGVSKSDVMIAAQNRIYMAYDTSMEYSVEGDAFDYSTAATRAGAGVEDFPTLGGYITGLSTQQEYIFIGNERTWILFSWQYPDSISKTPDFKHLVIGDGVGPVNQKGIANVYNDILYTARKGVKQLFVSTDTNNWVSKPITDIIMPNITNYDFSEAAAVHFIKEDVYLVACKSKDTESANNRVIAIWFYEENGARTAGISILKMTVDCWILDGDELYFGSSMEGNVYQAFTGSTFYGTSIEQIYTTNRDDYGGKNIKGAEALIIEGFIKSGSKIEGKVFFDGGRTATQSFEINFDDDCVGTSALNTLGSYALGEEVIGGLYDDSDGMLPFRKVLELQDVNFYDLQVEYKGQVLGNYFEIYYQGLLNMTDTHNLSPN